MAKSKLGVVENGVEQTVVEPEAGISNQSAPEIPAVPESGEAPAPELTDEEAAILAHEGEAALRELGEEQLEPPAPFDIPAPGDVVVPFEKIEELITESKAAAQIAAQDTPPDTLEQPPEKKTVRQERPPKAEKAEKAAPAKEDKAPASEKAKGPEKESEPTPAQKAGQTRKARNAQVIDFMAGKRTSPLPDGKPIPEPADEKKAPAKEQAPSPEPKEAPRKGEPEQIVYITLSELHAFKNHPFQIRDDEEMRAMVESVKDKGVTQPAIVRPREDGGYEIVSGHRRQKASELAGYFEMPCIVRNLTDEEAITQMVEDNTNQRENILPSERAKALQMQLEAIKKQGARTGNGQRSNEIVAERNKMTVKQVQRYIKLNDLVPDLSKMVDEKKIAFTPAVEMSYIKPKNQRYIAVAIEGQQSTPSLSQAQRMRELDQKGMLNGDVIDGIMLEEKKEVDKVIISSQELSQYFGKEKTPRDMKDQILKLLDEWKAKQPELSKPEKKQEQEK